MKVSTFLWILAGGFGVGAAKGLYDRTRPVKDRLQNGDIVSVPVSQVYLPEDASAVDFSALKAWRKASAESSMVLTDLVYLYTKDGNAYAQAPSVIAVSPVVFFDVNQIVTAKRDGKVL